MTVLNEQDEIGPWVVKCDMCGVTEIDDGSGTERGITSLREDWLFIFKQRPKPDFFADDFCDECANKLAPWVWQLRDIDELRLFVNKLERAIKDVEKLRNQNDGTTTHHVGERGQGRVERRLGC